MIAVEEFLEGVAVCEGYLGFFTDPPQPFFNLVSPFNIAHLAKGIQSGVHRIDSDRRSTEVLVQHEFYLSFRPTLVTALDDYYRTDL